MYYVLSKKIFNMLRMCPLWPPPAPHFGIGGDSSYATGLTGQEAPLTLRGQRGRCKNIKGNPKSTGVLPNTRLRPLFRWLWFYGGPWQTQAVY